MKRQNLRTVSLIVVTFTYLLIGAAIFGWLESEHEVRQREHLDRIEAAIRDKYNISEDDFDVLTTIAIKSVPHRAGIQWKFPGAFYFATTVVTTIGYGHSTPSTVGGRSFCMVYALIGIPLGLVMFQSIGERLNTFVGSALRHAKRCSNARNPEVTQTNLVMVVSVLSTILMTSMAAVFAKYERWDYFDALYYCFITLTTIGFGDYVALQKDSALQSKPEYVAVSLIFILFGLSVVSSAVNLLVLKFLTLNTEDERRDEQLRYTAAMNPIQLEGDVITSSAGGLEYARTKRPALTLSQAMASSTMMGDRQRRALVSAKLARSRPVLALKHSKLDLTQPVLANHQLRSPSGSSARSIDSSSRRAPQPDELHIQNARHQAEEDEIRRVIGRRARANCDELACNDNKNDDDDDDDDDHETTPQLRRRRPLASSSGAENEISPAWEMCQLDEREKAQRPSEDNKRHMEGEDDEEDEDSEDEDSDEQHQQQHQQRCCHFHNQNNNSSLILSADNSYVRAHTCLACSAHFCHLCYNYNHDNTSVRYPICSHNWHNLLTCPQRQQRIDFVPSSKSSSELHQGLCYYYPRGSLQSQCQGRQRSQARHSQLIPPPPERAITSTQLAANRRDTRARRLALSPATPIVDDGDADDEEHAQPFVELVLSGETLGKTTAGQASTHPGKTLGDHCISQDVLMNRHLRANQRGSCFVSSLQQLEQRYRHEQLELQPDMNPLRWAPHELGEQTANTSCCIETTGQREPHQAQDHWRPVRRKMAPSQAGALGANQSSCSCSWASLSAAVSHELTRSTKRAFHGNPPLDNQQTLAYSFHAAATATATANPNADADAYSKVQTSGFSTIGFGRFFDCNTRKIAAPYQRDRRSQKSFFQSSPAVHEIDHYDEQRSFTDDDQTAAAAAAAAAAAVATHGPVGQSLNSVLLQTSPAQPKSPTSTFDGGRPASRPDRALPTSHSSNFNFIDSKCGPETSATVSAKTTRPRRRLNEKRAPRTAQVPKLVCKCCCQHAECIEYALSSETTKQQPTKTNVISMEGSKNNDANTNKNNNENDATAAEIDLKPTTARGDCNQNPSELATSNRCDVIPRLADGVTSDDHTQGDGDHIDEIVLGQLTTTTGKMGQQKADGNNNQQQQQQQQP